jgi:hypothetical protein
MQSDTVAHDTAYSCPLETATVVDVLEPPNGLVQVITRGPPSHVTATHSATDGHEIPAVPEKPHEEPAVVTGLQVRAPPAGVARSERMSGIVERHAKRHRRALHSGQRPRVDRHRRSP